MFEVAEYRVNFFHERLGKPGRYAFNEQLLAQARTTCFIYSIDKGESFLEADSVAWCSREDQFSRSFGRKLSLTRSLDQAGFDKPTRSLFWEAYFKKRGKVG